MDFIDDFIEEYKNNPCLWKADSAHFKNRTKRQEAYMKLIDVAAKHGEHYNVERTKQKINNLRCAFRHQLKKYIEFKNKGEKDEPYCPKRRYFESLMFLKDEESPDRKSIKRDTCIGNSIENAKPIAQNTTEPVAEYHATNVTYTTTKPPDSVTITSTIINPEICGRSNDIKTTGAKDVIAVAAKSILEYEEEKSLQIASESVELSPNLGNEQIESQLYEFEKECPVRQKKRNTCRKRSSSLSSQLSNDTEINSAKTLKVDFTPMDIEKLFSLACKNISNSDDHFSSFGKIIAHKLRSMDATQALYAEKLIADVVFQGQMKLLSPLSINHFLSIDCSNSFGDVQTNK